MIEVEWIGLRGAWGRFAAMHDGELLVHQGEQAKLLATEIANTYRDRAPKSNEHKGDREPFSESFRGDVQVAADGFLLEVMTDQGDLRGWLKHGTGIFGPAGTPILPVHSQFMRYDAYGSQWFMTEVRGQRPNPWEDGAEVEVEVLLKFFANKIGTWVARRLAGPAED